MQSYFINLCATFLCKLTTSKSYIHAQWRSYGMAEQKELIQNIMFWLYAFSSAHTYTSTHLRRKQQAFLLSGRNWPTFWRNTPTQQISKQDNVKIYMFIAGVKGHSRVQGVAKWGEKNNIFCTQRISYDWAKYKKI
jgi:hypothetical protein